MSMATEVPSIALVIAPELAYSSLDEPLNWAIFFGVVSEWTMRV